MCSSSRFKVTIGISLLVILIIGLTFLGSTRVTTHAASTSLKLSTKLDEAAATPPATCGAWSVIPSPTFTGTGFNFFSGVAPVTATNVWAIGSYSNFSQTLIEHWNGRQWSIIPSPSPGLNYNDLRGVTAISAHNIWAVGSYSFNNNSPTQTLIEHWNGKKWSVVSSPNVGSAISNDLSGVRVLSMNNIWAVGTSFINNTQQQTLIEHWDGTSWSIVPSPNLSDVNALYQMAAISANDIWAVGTASVNTLVEHWDGTSWSIISSPSPGSGAKGLNGVTAISSTDVWAAGTAQTGNNGAPQTLIEHWDGTSWSVVPSPNVGSYNNTLNAVARVPGTSSQVWAVGSYNDSNDVGQTLTEFYC